MATAAEEAFREAERRIAAWREGEPLDLAIKDLKHIPVRIAALTNLQTVHCGGTLVSELSPLSALSNLQTLDCDGTRVSDLSPLSALSKLQTLECTGTQVSDLSPLSALANLQTLNCGGTPVSDLSPLSSLANLQMLGCWMTPVSDLSPLSALSNLQTLLCGGTQVSDLSSLSRLAKLQTLGFWDTQVSDLSPLWGLANLQTLMCWGTQVSDLSPLSGLANLQTLMCWGTQVSDLSPLSGLANLQTLQCWGTQVSDLTPLSALSNLQELNCSYCNIHRVPEGFWFKRSFRNLSLVKANIPGVPPEVLSQDLSENCLDSLRAHLQDLGDDPKPMRDAKLIILGNGRVGKTQICRKLRNEPYDDTIPSTHGIIVSSAPLPRARVAETGQLNIWDFGGQDIYHSTHTLFLRSRAIFLVAWTEDMETDRNHVHDGMVFRNYPLPYWLEYIRRFGGQASPVLLVQTQCDTPEMERVPGHAALEALKNFKYRKILQHSAREDRGGAALNEALAEAFGRLNQPLIGAGRLAVKTKLEAWRERDSNNPEFDDRLHRTLSYDDFLALCEETGGISNPRLFLSFLHNAGTVFYQPGLFDDQIVIDQDWALEAIYAVFNRDSCYAILKQLGGRFTRSLLGKILWEVPPFAYTPEEQELFISMMNTCGICFEYRRADTDSDSEAEYIAPDLLPETRPDVEIQQKWDAGAPGQGATLTFELLPATLIRSVISQVGDSAGLSGTYWKSGLYAYESHTDSRALIEQTMDGDWHGRITIRTQKGRANDLLRSLSDVVTKEARRFGLEFTTQGDVLSRPTEEGTEEKKLAFGHEQAKQPEYYVSYAWKDDRTPEGRKREEDVDRLCRESEAEKGIVIRRDKDDMSFGDSITRFMERIGEAERIFVFLSDKYLKSAFCMFELSEIWRNSRQREEDFVRKIRVFALPDADIRDIPGRLSYAAHWGEQFDAVSKAIEQHGAKNLSARDAQTYRQMQLFAPVVRDILAVIADRVQPRDFDAFMDYGFDDTEPVMKK